MQKYTDTNNVDRFVYTESIVSGKIHDSLEDPVSQLFYDISDSVSPPVHGIGITPNHITTLRLVLILFVFFYFFKNQMYVSASVIYLFAYFCDCLDGHMARKYNTDTGFGDYYDYIVDIITISLSLYFIAASIDKDYSWIMVLIFIILTVSVIHISCEEKYIDLTGISINSSFLAPIKCLCPSMTQDTIEQNMEIGRLFGIGVYHLFIFMIIWNFESISASN